MEPIVSAGWVVGKYAAISNMAHRGKANMPVLFSMEKYSAAVMTGSGRPRFSASTSNPSPQNGNPQPHQGRIQTMTKYDASESSLREDSDNGTI